jgi:cyclic pyranopterin phosphate synthase
VIAIAELPLADTLARPLRDLRISVTDRCQFRCAYCMPREVFGRDFVFLPRAELLTFEELTRLAQVFASLGVRKLRLTGGEPLLRRDLERLVAMLARDRRHPGHRPDHQRGAAGRQGPGAGGGGPPPGDGEPGLPRR